MDNLPQPLQSHPSLRQRILDWIDQHVCPRRHELPQRVHGGVDDDLQVGEAGAVVELEERERALPLLSAGLDPTAADEAVVGEGGADVDESARGGQGGGGGDDGEIWSGGGMGSREWSLIPADLLDLIASKSTDVGDYVCFRAVCKPWRSATNLTNPKLPSSLPWLLLTYNPDDPFRRFYSLSRRKFYTFHLPETRHRFLWGTSMGCLLMADDSFSLSLLNPITRALTHLPVITSFPKWANPQFLRIGNDLFRQHYEEPQLEVTLPHIGNYFHCYVFTSGDDECFVVVAVYDSPQLLYCKVGATATTWMMLHATSKGCVESVAYHDRRFYAVYSNADVVFWDVGSTETEGIFVQPPLSMLPSFTGSGQYGMVAFRGELMLVVFSYQRVSHEAKSDDEVLEAKFVVYKLTGDGWSNLEDICYTSMFVVYKRENMIMMGVGGDPAPGSRMDSIYFADVHKAEWFETFPPHQIHELSMHENILFLDILAKIL